MIKSTIRERVMKQISSLAQSRSTLQKISSDILSTSKKAIFAVHRDDLAQAKSSFDMASSLLKTGQGLTKKEPRLMHEGMWRAAQEEYTEAFLTLEYVTKGKITNVPDVANDPEIFLGALSDMAGELVRRAVMLASEGRHVEVEPIYNDVREAVEFLLEMDLTGNLRSKADQAKQHLRKLEDIRYDISMRR